LIWILEKFSKYCQKIINEGIFRFKQHLACTRKDVESCQQVPENVGTSSSFNVHNIGVGTNIDTNNPLDANNIR